MSTEHFKIGVMTAGGDCPGLNACIRAVVRSVIAAGGSVLGVPEGYRGLLAGQSIPLDARSVAGIIHQGGTILRTARCPELMVPAGIEKAAAQLDALALRGIVIIGGNGSMRGAWDIAQKARTPIIGVPKTIDNDVGGTEYAIGFDTAINTAMEAIDKIRDTAVSLERVFVVEVMGRSRGYLAAAVGLACGAEAVLVPEVSMSASQVAEALERGVARGKRSSIIVVAEGWNGGGVGLVAELKRLTGYEIRLAVLGYIQRGGAPTAFDRILGSRLGEAAVNALLEGNRNQLVGWSQGHTVLCELAIAWQNSPRFDPAALQLTQRLAGIW